MYDKAISINPSHDYAWNHKGILYNYSGDALHKIQEYSDAIASYDQSLKIKLYPHR